MKEEYATSLEQRVMVYLAQQIKLPVESWKDLTRLVWDLEKEEREKGRLKTANENVASKIESDARLDAVLETEFARRVLIDAHGRRLAKIEDARCTTCGTPLDVRPLARSGAEQLNRIRPVQPFSTTVRCQKCQKESTLLLQVIQ